MYHLDTNINTAIERQADRVRAVQAYGSRQATEQAAAPGAGDGTRRTSGIANKAILALAAAVPMVIVVWGMLGR